MAKETRHEMQGETRVRVIVIEPSSSDTLTDVIRPWVLSPERPGHFRMEIDYSPYHPDQHQSREDFIFHFTNPNTAFEFKMRFG